MINFRHVSILLVLSGLTLPSAKLAAQPGVYPPPYTPPGGMPGGTTGGTTGGMPGGTNGGTTGGMPTGPGGGTPPILQDNQQCTPQLIDTNTTDPTVISSENSSAGSIGGKSVGVTRYGKGGAKTSLDLNYNTGVAKGSLKVNTDIQGYCEATYLLVAPPYTCYAKELADGRLVNCADCDVFLRAKISKSTCTAKIDLGASISGEYGLKKLGGGAKAAADGSFGIEYSCSLGPIDIPTSVLRKDTPITKKSGGLVLNKHITIAHEEVDKILRDEAETCAGEFATALAGAPPPELECKRTWTQYFSGTPCNPPRK